MQEKELLYRIALNMAEGIGPIMARHLVAYLGSPENVFKANIKELVAVENVGPKSAKKLLSPGLMKKAEKEAEFVRKHKIDVLFYTDKDYPARLKHCPDSPVLVYVKGQAQLNSPKVLSVVGTRHATDYGREMCSTLIKELAARGHNELLVVSGLAYGIDICAHQAALDAGLGTVAVMGTGLNTIYPAAHNKYARQIVRQGALLTEYSTQIEIAQKNFVGRNRIVAGLADAMVLVESALDGGGMVTAQIANSYNRDVFAFPGKVWDKYSQGCNRLIKTHRAAVIETAEDIEYIMGWEAKSQDSPKQTELFKDLNNEEKGIVELLAQEQSTLDHISRLCKLPVSKVSSILLSLEFDGIVKSFPGKVYGLAKNNR
jgi:DNA processing protein